MATTSILKVRAEALRANLNNIKNHLENLPDPRTDLIKLDDSLTNIRKLLGGVKNAVSNSITNLDVGRDVAEVPKTLTEADQQLRNVLTSLREAGGIVESMRLRCYRIQETDIGKNIAKDLTARTDPCIQALAAVESSLLRPAPNYKKQWEAFLNRANDVNQSIFAQYIELLGGLALRDTGFDVGISRVADELLRTYSSKKNFDPLLAIPTRQQAVVMTLARIIRVTFPDWTIWALPSTAYEFWHVVAQKNLSELLTSAVREQTGNDGDNVEARFNDCLGDAFATYTMGPAYAYFAIFLLLNPSAPYSETSEHAADEIRAHGILKMLERMDARESTIAPRYAQVRQDLEEAWKAAITQTGAQAKDDAEKNRIEADKARVTSLVQALWATLKVSTSPPFTVEVWDDIQKWVEPLLKNNVEEIKVPQGAELRHVLNAAWLARVDPARSPELDITTAANQLAKKITKG